MVTNSVRRTLLASTIIAGTLAVSAPAFAQTAPAAAEAATEGETIVVTGSLISNPNLAQSSPVLVTTAEDIALRQNNVAEEVLRDIPGIVPSIGSAVNNGNGGASYVDLRGLGSNRNIVLLDGARIAPSGLVGRVDLNNIPLALIERVDALTGGASTTYGADAISGVVNFITKRNFSGVEIAAGEKITEKGDGNYLRADVTIGANFDDGRGNAVLSIGYQESDPVYQGDRDFSIRNVDSFSGTFGGSGTAVPSRFTLGTANRQINPTTGLLQAGFVPFNFNPYNIFQTPFRRYNMYAAARYEVSDAVEIYSRALFSKNSVKTIIAPSGIFASSVVIPVSNPYLPIGAAQQFCAANDFNPLLPGIQTISAAECTAARTALTRANPAYREFTTILRRRVTETGTRNSEFLTTIFDYQLGAKGAITDTVNWDVRGAYGESENAGTATGYVLTSKVRDALLATNTATCLSAATGCVPLNVFGPEGSITAAQAAGLLSPSTTTVKTTLAQVRGLVSGNLGFTVPSASDPVDFAIGTEYRKYGAEQKSDTLAKSGDLGGGGGVSPDINGGYSVYEFYGELIAPLVQDKPGFDELTVKGGVRYSSYKVDAPTTPKYNTLTYKGELTWAPVRDIKFRGSYSRAVRAPNINELFNPVTTGLTSLSVDPCAGAAPVANANLRAVCIAQGAPAAAIGTIANPTAGQANVTSGGNLAVKPEKSTSYTLGVILSPSFVPGLSLTVDYYNIKVKDAITTPTPGDVIQGCFGAITAASATDPKCIAAIRRNTTTGTLDGDTLTTPGLITQLTNQGQLRTDGIDVALNYRRDLGVAKFSLSVIGNYTFHSNFKSNQSDAKSVDRNCVGYFSVNCGSIQPKFQWTVRPTISFGDVDLSVLWRHLDKVAYEATAADYVARGLDTGATPNAPALLYKGNLPDGSGPYDFNRIKAYDYFDLTARFGITSKIDITLGVNNVFNRKPPLIGSTAGTTGFNSGNTYPSTYDALGRSFAASAKVRF
jgi:iron complex outermembrane recepter protein